LAADVDKDVAIDDMAVDDVAGTWQMTWQPHGRHDSRHGSHMALMWHPLSHLASDVTTICQYIRFVKRPNSKWT
jgi:hypothetical protein